MRTRQKVILSILLRCKLKPTRTQLFKWLFLLRQESSLASDPTFYDFLPYRYGPYSFEAYHELEALGRSGLLDGGVLLIPSGSLAEARALEATLPPSAKQAVGTIMGRYGTWSTRVLLNAVYDRYPWYASQSTLRPATRSVRHAQFAVYTVGYQEKSLDAFLDGLLRSGIKALIDVRSNPLSRKFGFSGSSLQRLAPRVGIQYVHFSQLGIVSTLRRGVTTPSALQDLLDRYERDILPHRASAVAHLARLLGAQPSALMCFEADPSCCHRGRLAAKLAEVTHLPLVHL